MSDVNLGESQSLLLHISLPFCSPQWYLQPTKVMDISVVVPELLDAVCFQSLLSLLLLFGRFTDIPSCSETLPSATSSLLLSPLEAVLTPVGVSDLWDSFLSPS